MERLTWPREDVVYAALTLALTIFAVAPLAYPGYMQVHSGFVPSYNLADLARQPLNPGWPGWTPHVATGFDPLRGDGLLPYYLALPLVWLGGTSLVGVKAIFVLGFLLGAAGMFVWLRRPLGPVGATLAALVYTYLPYHIAAVYVRGAWGEALCLGLLPWALAETQARSGWRWGALAALAWALAGLSQLGLAVWGLLLGVAWAALSPWAVDPPPPQPSPSEGEGWGEGGVAVGRLNTAHAAHKRNPHTARPNWLKPTIAHASAARAPQRQPFLAWVAASAQGSNPRQSASPHAPRT